MTIIAGVVDKDCVYLGTDSLISFGSDYGRCNYSTGKFLDLPTDDLVIASAGAVSYGQIFEEILRQDESTHLLTVEEKYDVQKLARLLYERVRELGVGDSENNKLPDHEGCFLVVSKDANKIWAMDGDYAITEWDTYIALGSGSTVCESVIWAALECDQKPLDALILGLKASIEFTPNCGGKIHIKQVSQTDTSSGTPQPS